EKTKSLELLKEYLNFGGYPRIVLEDELSEKLLLIGEIYQSYIEKDISYLLKVHKIEAFGRLVKLMAAEEGNIIKLTELSSELGISIKTLKDYLWYLEKTFIINRVYPFFKNIRKELSKSTIFYFYDIGLRNFTSGEFGNLKDYGFVFQNFIYNILREKLKNSIDTIYFWRTKDKAEIDFVIEKGKNIIPVEVKYKHLKSPLITRAMRSFIEKYRVDKAIVFNLSLKDKIKIETTEILILPYYESLFNIL
ncbi:MAG: ATPase, partial [Caldiserica bacterium]